MMIQRRCVIRIWGVCRKLQEGGFVLGHIYLLERMPIIKCFVLRRISLFQGLSMLGFV